MLGLLPLARQESKLRDNTNLALHVDIGILKGLNAHNSILNYSQPSVVSFSLREANPPISPPISKLDSDKEFSIIRSNTYLLVRIFFVLALFIPKLFFLGCC